MKKKIRILPGILVIVLCLVMVQSMVSSVEPYKNVSAVVNNSEYKDADVQVTGKIVKGTFTPSDHGYLFTLSDGNASMKVKYCGRLPSAFNLNSKVVVIGSLTESGSFEANKILAPCPSKYEG